MGDREALISIFGIVAGLYVVQINGWFSQTVFLLVGFYLISYFSEQRQ